MGDVFFIFIALFPRAFSFNSQLPSNLKVREIWIHSSKHFTRNYHQKPFALNFSVKECCFGKEKKCIADFYHIKLVFFLFAHRDFFCELPSIKMCCFRVLLKHQPTSFGNPTNASALTEFTTY